MTTLVLLEAVVLHFEEEVVLAEHVRVFVGEAAGVVVLVGQEGFVDVAAQAGRQRDQAFGVAREQVLIDARLVVEAVEVAGGDQVDQVAVAFLVFAEQDQVVVAVGVGAGLVALLRDVNFAADDRMDAFRLGRVVELDGAEEVAVIGHGDGGHLLALRDLHQLLDFAGAVEQRVVGMAVEMDERAFAWYIVRVPPYFNGVHSPGTVPVSSLSRHGIVHVAVTPIGNFGLVT